MCDVCLRKTTVKKEMCQELLFTKTKATAQHD